MLRSVSGMQITTALGSAEFVQARLIQAGSFSPVQWLLRPLLICFGLLAGISVTACAQTPPAQLVKKALTVQCGEQRGEQRYDVGFVSAHATLNNGQPTRALGIILSEPNAPNPSRVFCLYWIGNQDNPATHRDDDSGPVTLQGVGELRKYGDGQIGVGKASMNVVASFFKRCPDPQAVAIKEAVTSVSATITLKGFLDHLKNKGGRLTEPEERPVIDASGEELKLFNIVDITNAPESMFAQAVHQFVNNTWTKSLRPTPTPSPSPTVTPTPSEKQVDEGWSIDWRVYWLVVFLIVALAMVGYWLRRSLLDLWWRIRAPKGKDEALPNAQPIDANKELAKRIPEWKKKQQKLLQGNKPSNKKQQQQAKQPQEAREWQALCTEILAGLENLPANALSPGNTREEKDPFVANAALVEDAPASGEQNQMANGRRSANAALAKDTSEEFDLQSEIRHIRSTVDELAQRKDSKEAGEARKFLKWTWQFWYGRQYQEQKTDSLAHEIQAVAALCRDLAAQFGYTNTSIEPVHESWNQVSAQLECVWQGHFRTRWDSQPPLNELVDEIVRKLDSDKQKLKDYTDLQMRFNNANELVKQYFNTDMNVNVFEITPGLLDEHSRSLAALGDYAGNDLPQAIGEVVAQARRANSLETERDKLQTGLKRAQAELVTSKELVTEIGHQLNFDLSHLAGSDEPVSSMLGLLRKEKEESVYSQLRMGLSAALIALDKAIAQGNQDKQKEVLDALYINRLKEGLKKLLTDMQRYSNRELWEPGLYSGFDEGWLHYLLRAEMLLRNYFADQKDFSFLHEAISIASSSVQAALFELKVEVSKIELFEPLPNDMPTDSVYPALRNLPAVGDKVRRRLETDNRAFIIDVLRFPIHDRGIKRSPGRAVPVNPSAWKKG